MTMMENQNATIHNAKDFRRDSDPMAFEVKGGDDRWNPKFVDVITFDNVNGIRDSSTGDHESRQEKDLDSVSSNTTDKGKMHEHERSMKVDEFAYFAEIKSRDSPIIAASGMTETEKDIRIDEGMPMKVKISRECCKEENSHCDSTEGGFDVELFISDDLEVLENTKGVSEDESVTKEEESSFDEDIAKHGASKKISVTNTSNKESFVDKTLPIEEFGTRSFLRSFLSSLDCEENKVAQPPDEMRAAKKVSESLAVAPSREAEPKEDVKASLLYESKVESRSITFNFNSPTHTMTAGDAKERYVDSGESSFSAAGGVTYSGPISYSGSLSLRSDESTTSGKSFAFPVLQSEWNSSPVRMTKGDGRNFRKHKGWRPGLFCCRF